MKTNPVLGILIFILVFSYTNSYTMNTFEKGIESAQEKLVLENLSKGGKLEVYGAVFLFGALGLLRVLNFSNNFEEESSLIDALKDINPWALGMFLGSIWCLTRAVLHTNKGLDGLLVLADKKRRTES